MNKEGIEISKDLLQSTSQKTNSSNNGTFTTGELNEEAREVVEKNKDKIQPSSFFGKNYINDDLGYYQEDLISITKKGRNGQQEIAEMMESFRADPPKELAGSKVVELLDYDKQVKTDLTKGSTEKITLPKSNVLQFITEDGSKISARPSGTEPKIKFYFSVKTNLSSVSDFEATQEKTKAKIDQIIREMKLN